MAIPAGPSRWKRMFVFAGPAFLVSVGYMDPGNWATDLEGGARFGYKLIWVLLMSNLIAVLLQTLSARLGLITGRDLAQACRDSYRPAVRWTLFVLCEIAIAACDLAEVIGSAVGLNLLFHIPLLWAVLITATDVLVLLAIQRLGIRKMEAFILTMVLTIGVCFLIEIVLSPPSAAGVLVGFIPGSLSRDELYVAIGILGATVMPHNLYLHSALVQSRDVARSRGGVRQASRYNLIDSFVALNGAFLVNSAILIVAAATFFSRGIVVTELQQAHQLLHDVLGSSLAPAAFAIALLAAGQSSTITGTLAGQITMEGFLDFRIRPWVRRLITRLLAIVPAVVVIILAGDHGIYELLILSQVVLSLQLPFAVVPLVKFTSSRRKMGEFASGLWVKILAWVSAALIVALNARLVAGQVSGWMAAAGDRQWLLAVSVVPIVVGLAGLLGWMAFRREPGEEAQPPVSADAVAAAAEVVHRPFRRIGLALDASDNDAVMLAEGVALARTHGAALVLMHVVDGASAQWFGPQIHGFESREDEIYLRQLADRLRADLVPRELPEVAIALGYGSPVREVIRMVEEHGIELLVVGGHGHRGLADLVRGETIQGVRHGIDIPILAVRGGRSVPRGEALPPGSALETPPPLGVSP